MNEQQAAGKSQPVLQLHNATVYRSKQRILHQLSLQIDKGGHTAIVGPNGSGKSTLIKLLTYQLHPVTSEDGIPPIRVFGKNRWDVAELRRRVGIVSSDFQYYFLNNIKKGRITGVDVVVSGFFSSLQLFPHQKITGAMREQARATLERMDAAYLADTLFREMSAGEARRVLIARSLITSPEALVLDEPTTALDFVARHNCMELIRSLAQQGTTIILITHHIDEIIPEIERVILLKDGEAVYDGPKETTLTAENLSDTFGHPVGLHCHNGMYSVRLDGAQAD